MTKVTYTCPSHADHGIITSEMLFTYISHLIAVSLTHGRKSHTQVTLIAVSLTQDASYIHKSPDRGIINTRTQVTYTSQHISYTFGCNSQIHVTLIMQLSHIDSGNCATVILHTFISSIDRLVHILNTQRCQPILIESLQRNHIAYDK